MRTDSIWSKSELENRVKLVEKTLQPLITQFTQLASLEESSKLEKGRSKKGIVLINHLVDSIKNFISNGTVIADEPENADLRSDLINAIRLVEERGKKMIHKSRIFVKNPLSNKNREDMIELARELLSAVVRLLALADCIDMRLLVKIFINIKTNLDKMAETNDHKKLLNYYNDHCKYVKLINNYTSKDLWVF
jgi:hypothetical protein